MFVHNAIRFTPASKRLWTPLVESIDSTSDSVVVAAQSKREFAHMKVLLEGANGALFLFQYEVALASSNKNESVHLEQ